jgi:RNA polymerase sigma-54 factor
MIPRLEMRQSQALVMTPQLQQAIKLLQLSNLELKDYVEQELEENPLLERDEEEPDGSDSAASDGSAEEGDRPEDDLIEKFDHSETGNLSEADLATRDLDYDNEWNNDSPADADTASPAAATFAETGTGGAGNLEGPGPNLEQTLSKDETLREHLLAQLNVDFVDPVDRVIGLHLIDMLDEAGYLTDDLMPVAELLNCSLERVEATLTKLQQFDPPGIFARDLAECLRLQLGDRNRLDPAINALLDNLDLLANRDMNGLADLCGVDAEDVADMVAEIRALNPKPALAFDHVVAQPITPDIFMRPRPGSGWTVELSNDTLPKVLVNNLYYAEVSRAARTKADKQYISEQFQSANWLIKSLHQRATTILKVATEIVRQQENFFIKGVQHLKPLVLRDISEAIEMHESTVSRVTSNKFMVTPRGIYELKYFFTTAISNASGGAPHSAESVRQRIKSLIGEESVNDILSDDRVVVTLKAENIDIARRTVAKYREALGIPSSVQRRRDKAGQLPAPANRS